MGLFDNYDNLSKNYIPNNLRDVDINKYTTTSPYEEYDINGNHIGYFWYYGDTVNLQFNIDGLITVDNNSIIYNVSGDAPNESVPGEINQKAYNIVDYISWTCVAIIEDKYIWAEDKVFEAPDNGGKLLYISAKNFLKDMLYKICIYNGRYELLYTFDGNASTNISLHIDEDLSKELVKGIYYITLTVANKNSTNFIPLIKDKECILLVK